MVRVFRSLNWNNNFTQDVLWEVKIEECQHTGWVLAKRAPNKIAFLTRFQQYDQQKSLKSSLSSRGRRGRLSPSPHRCVLFPHCPKLQFMCLTSCILMIFSTISEVYTDRWEKICFENSGGISPAAHPAAYGYDPGIPKKQMILKEKYIGELIKQAHVHKLIWRQNPVWSHVIVSLVFFIWLQEFPFCITIAEESAAGQCTHF